MWTYCVPGPPRPEILLGGRGSIPDSTHLVHLLPKGGQALLECYSNRELTTCVLALPPCTPVSFPVTDTISTPAT